MVPIIMYLDFRIKSRKLHRIPTHQWLTPELLNFSGSRHFFIQSSARYLLIIPSNRYDKNLNSSCNKMYRKQHTF